MAIRKQSFAVNEYYHLYNRGTEKRKIFLDKQDYRHFLFLMHICNSEKSIVLRDIGKFFDCGETIVDIGAYCLMSNHFHILVREKEEGGISKYMLKLMTGYSMYFNKKYKRTGSLFEGKFKSKHIGKDNYFNYLFSYIHLNPIKLIQSDWKENGIKNQKEAISYLADFPYSSFQDFFGFSRKEGGIINRNSLSESFKCDNVSEIFEWIKNFPQV